MPVLAGDSARCRPYGGAAVAGRPGTDRPAAGRRPEGRRRCCSGPTSAQPRDPADLDTSTCDRQDGHDAWTHDPGTAGRSRHLSTARSPQEVDAGFERVLRSGRVRPRPGRRRSSRTSSPPTAACTRCVGVANGTDAVELALRAVGVGEGDEVIIPANTFVATAGGDHGEPAASPVLVDCDPDVPADGSGHRSKRASRRAPGDHAGAPVRAARADGAGPARSRRATGSRSSRTPHRPGRRAARQAGRGRSATSAATSFYPGKNLGAYGDAGAVVTNSDAVADAVLGLRNHGGTVKYQHPELGFNSRLDTLQAVVLRAKLRRLDGWNAQRRAAADRYASLLAGMGARRAPRATLPGNQHVWHLYVVQVDERDRVLAEPERRGIGAGIHYPVPVHLQGAYRRPRVTAPATSRSPSARPAGSCPCRSIRASLPSSRSALSPSCAARGRRTRATEVQTCRQPSGRLLVTPSPVAGYSRPTARASPPRVTVVVPCYNYGHFLPECVASASTKRAWTWTSSSSMTRRRTAAARSPSRSPPTSRGSSGHPPRDQHASPGDVQRRLSRRATGDLPGACCRRMTC